MATVATIGIIAIIIFAFGVYADSESPEEYQDNNRTGIEYVSASVD